MASFFCTMSLLLLPLLLSSCLPELGSNAQLLPLDEARSLKIISDKLKITYWGNINRTFCNQRDHNINHNTTTTTFLSKVTCNCSYNQGAVCHVTNILLKGLNLAGILPEELGDLTHLQEFDISLNKVSGSIPKSLSKIPLVKLSLYGNRISGSIPVEIGRITTLQELVLEDNDLGGNLPQSLGNLKNLKRLVLAGNNFTGKIPEAYANLKSVIELRVNGNGLSGKLPDFIGNLTNLQMLDMQGTSMEGPIPSSFSQLTNLTILAISDLNSTSMTFPNLMSLTNLTRLVLRNCFITGSWPDYIQAFSSLKLLDLSYNQLSGPIPDSMPYLPGLVFLILTNNSFSGPLPNWILNSKQKFDVSYNNFTGLYTTSCQLSNVNLVASYSSQKNNSVSWCLMKDLPCTSRAQYHSLFINCGGGKMTFQGHEYEEDFTQGGPSNFFASDQKWAYSSTGPFMYNESANFLWTAGTSYPNVTGIYQTARLAPLSLKYYGLCLRQGSYNVKLHFAEIMFSDGPTFNNTGKRIFDVAIQGRAVLQDFNIAEEAGGNGKQIVKEFKNVTVNDGKIEIYLYWSGKGTTGTPNRNTYGPLISGITVTPNFKTDAGLSAGAIAGVVLASSVIFVMVLLALRMKSYLCRKDHADFHRLNTGYFTLKQIKTATDDFSSRNKIGEGGFGPVYKGVLPDGKVIAVKQLSSKSKQGNREFVNEIGMISALQHPNLVKLYGCCVEGKELLLVYEYMENNSLARALFGQEGQKLQLDWGTRKNICWGIASGLVYLHEESRLKIVHRDIKATNVLLDKELNAKISDFGLAKLDEEENTHISTRIAGTVGYMAPEYAMRGYLTDKADVYSFGVVVLEIVSGKSNTNYRPKDECIYLLDWACVLQEQGNVLELVDPTLGSNYSKEEAMMFINLALLCTNSSPTLRPTMSSVRSMIDGHIPVQAPIVKQKGTDEVFRLKAFGRRSQDDQSPESGSIEFRQLQGRTYMDVPFIHSSVSSEDNEYTKESSSSRILI